MAKPDFRPVLVIVAVVMSLASVTFAIAADRVALVIGNADYKHTTALANTTNDARDVADALEAVGFDVTRISDLGVDALRKSLRDFARASDGSEMAVVFYAGHGMEMNGTNYLIPVDAVLQSDRDVGYEAIPLDMVTEAVSGASVLRLVMLDACRNNPFATKMKMSKGTRAVSRGLARVEPEVGTLVAYAAQEGTVASDGDGGNSPFTKALVSHIKQPGLEVSFLFRKVRDAVIAETGGAQQPFTYGSLPGREIYFTEPGQTAPFPVEPQVVAPAGPSAEFEAWSLVKDTQSVAILEAFEKRFPESFFAELARIRIDEMRQNKSDKEDTKQVAALVPEVSTKPLNLTRNRSWKMAGVIPSQIDVYGPMAGNVAAEIGTVSGGKLDVRYFGPGEMIGAFETFDAVSSGQIDLGWSNAAYWGGQSLALSFFSGAVPFGMTPEKLVAWMAGEGGKLRDEVYAPFGIKSLSCGIVGPGGGGWYVRELKSANDLKGLKVRMFGTASMVFQAAGGSPQAIAGGEIYPALESGVIDGAILAAPYVDAKLGFGEVAKFYYYPAWSQPAVLFDLLINLSLWNGLSEDEQLAISRACETNLRKTLHAIPKQQSDGLAEIRSQGIDIRTFPADVLDALRKANESELKNMARGDPMFARVLASFERNR
jgi:TRAP-type mannitol/chloroaromatic compound transport system substrate-binding protein